jgi:hypothetical protein
MQTAIILGRLTERDLWPFRMAAEFPYWDAPRGNCPVSAGRWTAPAQRAQTVSSNTKPESDLDLCSGGEVSVMTSAFSDASSCKLHTIAGRFN